MKKMKLSFAVSFEPTAFQSVGQGDWIENSSRMSAIGYDGIELAVKDPSRIRAGDLKGHLERFQLSLVALGTGQAYWDLGYSLVDDSAGIRGSTVDLLKKHIDLASRFGARVIIGLIRGKLQGKKDRERAYRFFADGMVSLDQYAAGAGVSLVIEPINRYETDTLNTVEETIAFIEKYQLRQTGILLDTFHMNIEESRWEESIQRAGPLIRHVHIADSNRRYPGSGHLDFSGITTMIDATGYHDFYSGEMQPLPDIKTAMQEYYNTMRSSP